jgi:hypothetical protein
MTKKSIKPSSQPDVHTLKEEVIIRTIKIIDIAFITFLYGISALIVAAIVDKYIYKKISLQNIDDKDKSVKILLFELLICLAINGIIAYFLRNILQMVPFPLDGIYGFSHMRVTEVKSGAIITFILLFFSKSLRARMTILQGKLT